MRDESTPLTGDGARTTRGPRHAAPRKSLLAKLQRPAGKAMVLAAMPTAVLVGMGLAPKLALAEDKDIPFAPGPCVTRSDAPSPTTPTSAPPAPEPSPSGPGATTGASPAPSATGAAAGSGANAPAGKPEKSPEKSPGNSPEKKPEKSPGIPARGPGRESGAPESPRAPAPDPAGPPGVNPLDPLGLGKAIGDLLRPPGRSPSPTPAPAAPSDPAPSTKPPAKPPAGPSTKPPLGPDDGPTVQPSAPQPDGRRPTPGGETDGEKGRDTDRESVRKAIEEAARQAGATVEELDDEVGGTEPVQEKDIPDGAKPRFPCPTPDPRALADAKTERGLPLLPDEPWILQSSRLTLYGLDYHGIVEVRTGSGKVKKVLKFTASGIDIRDLHQLVDGPGGTTLHAQARAGSTSTIRQGTVTMYTEELKGNLFGLIPITFSPRTPPPLNLSFAFFTQARVVQAGQFGGTLTIPGLRNSLTGTLGG
ncbi:hypothetical protein [Streptomyces yaizuensis]|uniref:Hydrogenase expression protein HypF n=1 Tax=Streptomyces yaizuensis TaxID=2989713 RepID=A0ABQ5NWK1_9ACTN|nr:hypothetical protein [Streptomyces sp. YSPA8]GLF94729.1 hydrogenase expression protein HypF [Streptomyces sp. YSPA8]